MCRKSYETVLWKDYGMEYKIGFLVRKCELESTKSEKNNRDAYRHIKIMERNVNQQLFCLSETKLEVSQIPKM